MQKLYTVKSENYLAPLQSDAEYNWFVYQRPTPVLPYEVMIEGYSEVEQIEKTGPNGEQGTSNAVKAKVCQLTQKAVDAMFTLDEATQLQAYLEAVFPDMTVTLQEVALPVALDSGLSSLNGEINFEGDYVDPKDFAALEENYMEFQVIAYINYKTHYVAEDFLLNLSPARLAELRKMHAENNG